MKHIFGPVPSRRLGMSLGVDLVKHKICTFDCVYCECGKTTELTTKRREYVKYEEIENELLKYFENNPDPDYFTFSGSGEPTLNSCIGKVLRFIKRKRPDIPVAVLTNGSLLYQKDLREELNEADLIIPSLDAVVDSSFRKINVPCEGLTIDSYIQGITDLRKEYYGQIWLEVFILPDYNDASEDILALKEILGKIEPDKVQINTLDRPGRIENLRGATEPELQKIIKILNFPNIEIISAVSSKTKKKKTYRKDIKNAILETVSRRPCTVDDLTCFLNLRIAEVNKYLRILESENKIESIHLERGIFFKLK